MAHRPAIFPWPLLFLCFFLVVGDGGSLPHLQLRLQHRHAPGSPVRTEFSSRAEEVAEMLARDAGGKGRGKELLQQQGGDWKAALRAGASLGTGNYLVDFYLGTPARKLSLIVETGSDLLWTQCSPCQGCYSQIDPLYVPANSSSFSVVPCNAPQCFQVPAPDASTSCDDKAPGPCLYRYQYSDASFTTGILGRESVTLKAVKGKDVTVAAVPFGCANAVNQGSFGKADGVLSMGRGPLAFPQQIAARFGRKFAYCIVDFSLSITSASLLVFGPRSDSVLASKAHVAAENVRYTPLFSNALVPIYYYVRPVGLAVAGCVVPVKSSVWRVDAQGNGGTVLDSGVTLTYLQTQAYQPVVKAFQAAVRYPQAPAFDATLRLCYNVTGVKKPEFPPLQIWFKGGALMEPPTANVFVNVGKGIMCLAIGEVASSSGPNFLGNLLQQNFLVVYDPDRSRIGFAPARCAF